MIYITGDTHGDFGRFSRKKLHRQQLEFTEKDYVIVCGDLGLCWTRDGEFKYNCELFAAKPYTLLWVQGNHENYDMIEEFPIEMWHGGKARHIVRDKVILLERGQIFEIEGHTFFIFGGASSHDIDGGILDRNDPEFHEKKRKANRRGESCRILHESWWPQELPSEEEMQEGIHNLEQVDYKVDYVITHCCSTQLQEQMNSLKGRKLQADVMTEYFSQLEEKLQYKKWFFGHYHLDMEVDEKHQLLYHAIMPLEEEATSAIPILGKPRYHLGDVVEITYGLHNTKLGKVYIVDAYGTFEQNLEPSYDILVEEENCLYKHICESDVIRLIQKGECG